MFPKNLILIRHAECASNVYRRRIDQNLNDEEAIQILRSIRNEASPLTSQGIRNAKTLGPMYYEAIFGESRHQALFFCSPYRRAIETAVHLTSEWQRPVADWQSGDNDSSWPRWQIDTNLSERSWGDADGISWRQYEEQYSLHASNCKRNPLQHLPPFQGAESLAHVRSLRVQPFLDMLKDTCNGNEIVIVITHFDWILSCRALIEHLDPFRFAEIYSRGKTIRNLDSVWYSTKSDNLDIAASEWPQRFAILHFSDICENPETARQAKWEKIERRTYSTEELRSFIECI